MFREKSSLNWDSGSLESLCESVQIEMQAAVKRLAYPSYPGESAKSCIRRVSRFTGLSFSRVKKLWYGESAIIPAHIADYLRSMVVRHESSINLEIDRQRDRLNKLYVLANHSSDPEFYRTAIAQAVGRADEPE